MNYLLDEYHFNNEKDPYYILQGPDLMYPASDEYKRFWPYLKKQND